MWWPPWERATPLPGRCAPNTFLNASSVRSGPDTVWCGCICAATTGIGASRWAPFLRRLPALRLPFNAFQLPQTNVRSSCWTRVRNGVVCSALPGLTAKRRPPVQGSERDAAVRTLLAAAGSQAHHGHCLQLFASYRAVALPLAVATARAAVAAAPPVRMSVLTALADAACLLPAIRPVVRDYAAALPHLPQWLLEHNSGTSDPPRASAQTGHDHVAAAARAMLLLLEIDRSYADLWPHEAVLRLLLHKHAGVRWAAAHASALIFRCSNAESASLQRRVLSEQEAADCVTAWESHYSRIEVRSSS